ncbi:MAG: LysE family translocator [Ancalomicrobiaceae bacterium]|nr:LysE family translocator [Ancalomicrobiaceae bacterium]
MHFDTWLAFVATSAIVVVIPGPTVLLVASYALGRGWRVALPMALGVVTGDFTAMTLSMLGLGALLAASATVFTALKWLGAAYLVYLGIKLWRAKATIMARPANAAGDGGRMFGHAWLVTALNPKSLTFFIAFLPQFFDLAQPIVPQMAIAEATFLVLAFVNVLFYAAMASRARRAISNPRTVSIVNKVGGSLLVGAGVAAATLKAA